jgi:hypothetical protein
VMPYVGVISDYCALGYFRCWMNTYRHLCNPFLAFGGGSNDSWFGDFIPGQSS